MEKGVCKQHRYSSPWPKATSPIPVERHHDSPWVIYVLKRATELRGSFGPQYRKKKYRAITPRKEADQSPGTIARSESAPFSLGRPLCQPTIGLILDPNHGGGAHFSHRKNTIFSHDVLERNTGTIRAIVFRETSAVLKKEVPMKKLMFISFALAICLLALAQDTTKAAQAKQETAKSEKAPTKAVMGKVSADAKTFVDKDNKSWTVTNPEALKGHEGHEVTLKAHVDAAKNEIHVVSVKMGKEEMKEATKKEEKK
jgi:hypothetical protein